MKKITYVPVIALQVILMFSRQSLADQCDSVLSLGVVENLSQTNDISSTLSFRTWLKQAESKGACNTGGFDYTKYLQSSLSGSVSLCDAANKSLESSTSVDSTLRDQSITRLRSVNNAAIDAWKDCVNSSTPGFKYTYKIIPELESVQLLLRYIPSTDDSPRSVPVNLSDLQNLTCPATSFKTGMSTSGTSCMIVNPFKSSSVKISANATNGVSFLNVPSIKRDPQAPIVWPASISCGTTFRYFDNQASQKMESAMRKFSKNIRSDGRIFYLYTGSDKDRASIEFNKQTGFANSDINDEAYNPYAGVNTDRTAEGYVDYITQGCGGIFVEDLPS